MLEPLELADGHEHLGLQREAVVIGAQRSGQRRRARRAALAQTRERRRDLGRERGGSGG
jgi:hypothetical protein